MHSNANEGARSRLGIWLVRMASFAIGGLLGWYVIGGMRSASPIIDSPVRWGLACGVVVLLLYWCIRALIAFRLGMRERQTTRPQSSAEVDPETPDQKYRFETRKGAPINGPRNA